MFSFDVSFDKTQRFISVRADTVYILNQSYNATREWLDFGMNI